MAIHLIQRSRAYSACAASRAPADVVVLLGEGVVAATFGTQECYASQVDVIERGLQDRIGTGVQLISDEELVMLCAQHAPVVTWAQP